MTIMARRDRPQPQPDQGPAWFAPKKFGYGAGLPIAWQGWALLAAFLVSVLALAPLAAKSLLLHLSVTTSVTAVFLLIVKKTTRGGWRWRSGKEIE